MATIIGTPGNNTLTGTPGKDLINGLAGADTMRGLAGNDTYIVDQAGDKVQEKLNSGTDRVISFVNLALAAHVEYLVLKGAAVVGYGNALNNNILGNALANNLRGFNGDDVIGGANGNDIVRGGNGIDKLSGGNGNDRLYGDADNDVLNGGPGIDQLRGGFGDDRFVVANMGDLVIEGAGAGDDRVDASITYTLTPNVEDLRLTGSATTNGSGNGLDNTLTGNAKANTLNGGLGFDTLIGAAGNDILLGGADGDTLIGGPGNDALNGGADVDRYQHSGLLSDGHDTVVLIVGADLLAFTGEDFQGVGAFRDGNDLVIFAKLAANDTVAASGSVTLTGHYAGGDTASSFTFDAADNLFFGTNPDSSLVDLTTTLIGTNQADHAELIVGTDLGEGINQGGGGYRDLFFGGGGNDDILGDTGSDSIFGEAGGDFLNGAGGNDELFGGADPDTLAGGTGDDLLDGGADQDTVSYDGVLGGVGVSVSLLVATAQPVGAGQGLDTLIDIEHLFGSPFADNLTGNDGSNVLNGSGGIDTILGGAETDFLNGGADNDILQGDGGADQISGGAGNDDIEGSAGADGLNGDGDDDVITGGSENDILLGGDGADTLDGGIGFDSLTGGVGADNLTGGANADSFRYNNILDAGDILTDFTDIPFGHDIVRLHLLFDALGIADVGERIARVILTDSAATEVTLHIDTTPVADGIGDVLLLTFQNMPDPTGLSVGNTSADDIQVVLV